MVPAPALYKGLTAHLREAGNLLNGAPADPRDEFRTRLIVAVGESSVLAGWLAADMGDATAARSYYEIAEKAAKEAGDPGIAACELAYRSYIPSTKGGHGRSRMLLTAALETIEGYDSSPATTAWLAARWQPGMRRKARR